MNKHFTIIITLFLVFCSSVNIKSEECRDVKGSLLKELKERYSGYDVAYFKTFSKEQQYAISNNTKSECIHIVKIGSGSFAILLKIKNSNTYLISQASRFECNCPDWGFAKIDTISGDIPLMRKIQNKTYKDINGNEITVRTRRSILVEMVHSKELYLYDRDESKGTYKKIRLK